MRVAPDAGPGDARPAGRAAGLARLPAAVAGAVDDAPGDGVGLVRPRLPGAHAEPQAGPVVPHGGDDDGMPGQRRQRLVDDGAPPGAGPDARVGREQVRLASGEVLGGDAGDLHGARDSTHGVVEVCRSGVVGQFEFLSPTRHAVAWRD